MIGSNPAGKQEEAASVSAIFSFAAALWSRLVI